MPNAMCISEIYTMFLLPDTNCNYCLLKLISPSFRLHKHNSAEIIKIIAASCANKIIMIAINLAALTYENHSEIVFKFLMDRTERLILPDPDKNRVS